MSGDNISARHSEVKDNMPGAEHEPDTANRRRIREIVAKIAEIGLICSGTLLERTKTCGKVNCRCATDPAARHGPYYEWSWREEGRLVHKIVSADEARQLRKAIHNYQTLHDLLARWERASAAIILLPGKRKS
jgi:hypothetical protein